VADLRVLADGTLVCGWCGVVMRPTSPVPAGVAGVATAVAVAGDGSPPYVQVSFPGGRAVRHDCRAVPAEVLARLLGDAPVAPVGRCVHEMLPGQCAVCRSPAALPTERGPTVAARFEGPCHGGCGGWVCVGDPVVLVDGEWVCARDCGPG